MDTMTTLSTVGMMHSRRNVTQPMELMNLMRDVRMRGTEVPVCRGADEVSHVPLVCQTM